MRELVSFYSALADPTRLRLLHLLSQGDVCVCHLQEVLQTNQPKISRHLAYLRKAGLVKTRRDGKWIHYRMNVSSPKLRPLLQKTLETLQADPEALADLKRLAKIQCC